MSARYYFSGAVTGPELRLLEGEGVAGMVNYHRFAEQAAFTRLDELDLPLALDSGAFQGREDVEAYASFLAAHGDRFEWYANMDVIGDQAGSDYNFAYLCRQGFEPLWVFQGGDDLAPLADHARGQVGIGGLVPKLLQHTDVARRYLDRIGEVLAGTGARAHFFGLTAASLLKEYAREEWFASADGSTWLVGMKYGAFIDGYGRQHSQKDLHLRFDKWDLSRQNVRQIQSWITDPAAISLFG